MDLSVPICPCLPFRGLSPFFGEICPILFEESPRFVLFLFLWPMQRIYKEHSRKGPGQNRDLAQKNESPPVYLLSICQWPIPEETFQIRVQLQNIVGFIISPRVLSVGT